MNICKEWICKSPGNPWAWIDCALARDTNSVPFAVCITLAVLVGIRMEQLTPPYSLPFQFVPLGESTINWFTMERDRGFEPLLPDLKTSVLAITPVPHVRCLWRTTGAVNELSVVAYCAAHLHAVALWYAQPLPIPRKPTEPILRDWNSGAVILRHTVTPPWEGGNNLRANRPWTCGSQSDVSRCLHSPEEEPAQWLCR